jgi:3D (Asp-Asp-Asp) domain-containing protein
MKAVLNTLRTLKIAGLASLVGFVGATVVPTANPKSAALVVAAPVAIEALQPVTTDNNAELLHDATPVAAIFAPAPAQAAKRVRTIRMEVTAYCPCTKCCGENAQGLTASGRDVTYNGGRFVAADTNVLPFGTKLVIPGYEAAAVEVIDRGGAIKGNKLDLYYPTHEEALQWGRQILEVTIVE